jgi:lipopolysaccharide transport system permease protein
MHSSMSDFTVPTRTASGDVLTVRRQTSGRLHPRQILTYRPLIRALASRDLKARYKQSFLGPAWVVFQPLALLVAFAVGFRSIGKIQTEGVPYFLFALVGLTVWTYFQATLTVSSSSIIGNYALVRWTSCPRLALPLATLVSNLPSFAVTGTAALAATVATGHLSVQALLVPLLVAWLMLLTGALAVTLAALTVRARDVISVVPFFLQVLLFLSPVGYSTAQLSSSLQTIMAFNPLTGLIDAWRWSLLGMAPDMTAVSVSLVATVLVLWFGWRLFTAIEVVMADEI